jgi:hypothetical protein
MARINVSTKRLAIDKANVTMLTTISIAVFVVIFSLVASKALLDQRSYQSRVISKKKQALKQLRTNVKEVDKLAVSYQEFIGAPQNVLGGNPKGTAGLDGENSRIVLDALPSKYDFPALANSMDKLVRNNGFIIKNVAGTDDEINQAANEDSDSPIPIDIPFTIEATLNANDGRKFMELFERSIRPMQIQKISLKGQNNQISAEIQAKTYFQPAKNLNIKNEKVK